MWSRIVLVYLFYLTVECYCQRSQMCTVLTRSKMTYVLTESEKQELINRGYNFSQNNGIYTFTANSETGVVYITAHRLFSETGDVPYSLGVQDTFEHDDPVSPFPDYRENQNAPDGIYSAVSTTQDKCGNLWIVDQGIKEISNEQPFLTPGLLRFSFAANKITYRYRFPRAFFTNRGSTVTRLVIDDYFGCDKQKLIVADTLNHCLLIRDLETESSWKVCHSSMTNDPNYSNFKFENYTLTLPTGVYSLAITPPLGRSRTRYLMYASYSGITTYAVPLSIVYNKRLWTQGYSLWRPYSKFAFKDPVKPFFNLKKFFNQHEENEVVRYIDVNRYFTTIGSDTTHQGQYCDVDMERKLYFCAIPSEGAIEMWDLRKPYETRRIVVRNREKFLNAAILRVLNNRQGKNEIVMSTSPITQIFLKILKPDPRNYGVFACPVYQILQGDHVNCTSGVFNHCQ